MSAFEFKPLSMSGKSASINSRHVFRTSAGATLIELGVALVRAESTPAIPGLCSQCESERDTQSSTARYPNVFCSKECEQEFIRIALASLTLEDCIGIHHKLENLMMFG